MAKVAEGNVTLAFLFVTGAGLATTIGSAFVFCTGLANHKMLAGALGASAGVMLYVSFGEIFIIKGVGAFEESGYDSDSAMRYATFCFFAGMAFTSLLDKVVHCIASLSPGGAHGHSHGPDNLSRPHRDSEHTHTHPSVPERPPCCRNVTDELRTELASAHKHSPSMDHLVTAADSSVVASTPPVLVEMVQAGVVTELTVENGGLELEDTTESKEAKRREEKQKELAKMGAMTGLAIALHNFPEGLATFVATLADSSTGLAIAVAIALHNIPEGVCVAMPIYYATGSKWKGFWWAFLSGVSEPIGGLMGYLVLYGDNMSALVYGVLFSLVGGMMVYISIVELLPTALKYDPEDRVVSSSVLCGMAAMAASLLMFAA